MGTLLVGSFTDETGRGGLRLFDVSGAHLEQTTEQAVTSPTWLTWLDESAGEALAVCHTADSALVRVRVGDPRTIEVGYSRTTSGAIGCHLSLSPDGSAAAVAHYESGSIAVVPVGDEGFGDPTVLRFCGSSGVDPERQEGPHAHQVTWLDDAHLLVCDLGADRIRIVSWIDGHLREIGHIATTAGFGPRHLVLRGSQIAVGGELDGQVACYRHTGSDWTTGWSRVSQVLGTLVGGAQPSALRALDEHTLVIANRSINTLGVLEWHDSGQLVLADEFDCGGDHPRDLVVHEGRIWVANQNSDDICCFTRTEVGDEDAEPCSWQLASRTSVPAPGSLLFG